MNRSRFLRLLLAVTLVLVLSFPAFAGHGHVETPKKGILLVAFGTSVPEARVALDNIGEEVAKAFPNTEIRWAYSAAMIRNKIKKTENMIVPSPATALAQMGDEGFTHVAVQSLHTIPGQEFSDITKTALAFDGMPKSISHVTVGTPLLNSPADVEAVAKVLPTTIPAERKKDEAVIFMGHGTHDPGNIYYPGLATYLQEQDSNIFVGTVEGYPTLDNIIPSLKAKGIKKVWLMPFMSVAGDHARNDMAGDEDDSWKSILKKEGFKVQTVIKGTGEFDAVVALWVAHLKEAFTALDSK
ncbi:sirohydrochlorin cobaltochelatase [Halodesulfovibrio marinisediminis]|uniref:Sirohydrochlorin cobaltochelatase n=1 Tax=Halodesulfovibrio marinisediminis DSM 17456 TaxID=1121457 RepID=A0A1N6H231_9BACT|nr:sirohydrochlorin cobaltochelatase [Halodesulfovibrio marinisediminis]SIO13888.1 sirohydrochlorin cobaltochelatase [Halodesulfovibrio marinisediminis DSM 17456]